MARKYVIGIDEVGRGCLAGPVVVAALGIKRGFVPPDGIGEIRDSKKMTARQRLAWFRLMKDMAGTGELVFAVASVSASRIDKINISRAANEAAYRALRKTASFLNGGISSVTLDGGLYLKNKKFQEEIGNRTGLSVKTIVRADGVYREVMMASVFAKVFRDLKMDKLGRKFPGYGFSENKGYGTGSHITAIKALRPIPKVHRETFLKTILADQAGVFD